MQLIRISRSLLIFNLSVTNLMLSLHQLLPASPSYITVQERWPEIRHYFSQLSSYSADAEGKREKEKERTLLFRCGGSRWTLMNLGRRRSPTQSHTHTSAHAIYVTLLIAALLYPLILSVRTYAPKQPHTISRCFIFITVVGRVQSQPSTLAT